MKFIWKLIEKWRISSAQGRGIEAFIVWAVLSLFVGISDNILLILNGDEVSWRAFFISFFLSTSTSVVMAMQKYFRDLQSNIK